MFRAIIWGILFAVLIINSVSAQTQETTLYPDVQLPEPQSADDPYLLFRPTGLALLPGELIAVADQGEEAIIIINREGKHIITLGREGEGPGEFRTLVSVAYDPTINVLWGVDRRGVDGFLVSDWTYYNSFAKFVSGSRIAAINGMVYLNRHSPATEHAVNAFNHSGEFVGEYGSHITREVNRNGVGIYRLGSIAVIGDSSSTTLYYSYAMINNILQIHDDEQQILTIDDADLIDIDHANQDRMIEWDQEDAPRGYASQIRSAGNSLFLFTQLGREDLRIYELDYSCNLKRIWHLAETEHAYSDFVVEKTNGSFHFWFLAIWPEPLIIRFVER